jgi:hypothetical protein
MSIVEFYIKQISLRLNTQLWKYERHIPVQHRNKPQTSFPAFSYSCQNLYVILVEVPSESTRILRKWTVTFHWLIDNNTIHCRIVQRAAG